MINWPPELVREIVAQRCVLFLGSGVSASAVDAKGNRPPTWTSFLEQATELVPTATRKNEIRKLINKGKMLVALQAIQNVSNPISYNALLDKVFNSPYQPSRIHELIYDIDAKIVITTNFDKTYENYCSRFDANGTAYKTISYYENDDLADEIRSDTRLIIKAHGSINTTSRMIFTRTEYHTAKANHANFYDVLKAIFLVNTIVFIGCGLDDPDIMLLLEDVKITGKHRKPHYAVVLRGGNKLIAEDWRKTYNIHTLSYGPTHADLQGDLEALCALVQAERADRASLR
jgi:hypothetical protein